MQTQKYSVNQHLIETLLAWVNSGEINIQVGNRSPKEYFDIIRNQISKEEFHFGAITSEEELKTNMAMNCIPESILFSEVDGYEPFLQERRYLMAQKMKDYYFNL